MKKGSSAFVALVCVFFLNCSISTVSAETASCQIEQSGTVTDCMEFSMDKGMLPASLEEICASRASKHVHWVQSPCPRKNAVGECDISGKKMKKAVYCYKKDPKMPADQAVNSCKTGCKGTFKVYK
jgi:hypothetical protein